MNAAKLVNWLTITVVGLVFLILAGSFLLSYDALYAIGQANGAATGWRGYIWPLLIDAPLVVFNIALLVAQLARQETRGWLALVIAYTVVTIHFNLVHAAGTPYGKQVAVIAPTSLFLATESLRHVARLIIERQGVIVTMTSLGTQKVELERQVKKLQDRLAAQNDPPPAVEEDPRRQAEERRRRIEAAYKEGITSVSKLATLVDASETTIRRDLTALNGRVK